MMAHNILLSAVGRRPYLVRWFKDALASYGVHGKVVAADADPRAASRGVADTFLTAPRITDSEYPAWLQETLRHHNIMLALSVNDFELSKWAKLPVDSWQTGTRVIRLGTRAQHLVEDKYALSRALEEIGAPSPRTWLGKDVLRDPRVTEDVSRFVVKPRYGSGSAQLSFTDPADLLQTVEKNARVVRGQTGLPLAETSNPAEAIVVQELVEGVEYGVDVVSNLESQLQAVLVRKKLAMRNGETDTAVTENASRFRRVGQWVASMTHHCGLVDTDVLEDAQGQHWIIDVNPRFGGGYPFSHIAGADVPYALVGWTLGEEVLPATFEYVPGTVGAKAVDIVQVGKE